MTIVASFMIGTIVTGSAVYAAEKPNGQPFDAVWQAIGLLQTQVEELETTPGPQGPQGIPGPQGEDGTNGSGIVIGFYDVVGERVTLKPGQLIDESITRVECKPGDIAIGWGILGGNPYVKGQVEIVRTQFTGAATLGNAVAFTVYLPSDADEQSIGFTGKCADITP